MKTSNNKTDETLTTCKRCGTCCEKGGPAFHCQDRHLIEKGIIHSRHLYTIRKGELARDNITGELIPVSTDIIKIKGKGNTWECVFYNKKKQICEVYENRPIECRVLKCWDTEKLEDIYSKDYLTRGALIPQTGELWSIIKEHQEKCAYGQIISFNNRAKNRKDENKLKEITDIIRYDMSLRTVLVEKGNMEVETLDFLLGRPLVDTIKNYGFKVERKEDKFILTAVV